MLILAVMFSLAVPFDLSLSAAEIQSSSTGEPATNGNIYAMLHYVDSSNPSGKKNLELVFQNNNTPITGKTPYKVNGENVVFSGFAGTQYHTWTLKNNSNVPTTSRRRCKNHSAP